MELHLYGTQVTRVQFSLLAPRLDGEKDITRGFYPLGPGSIPGRGSTGERRPTVRAAVLYTADGSSTLPARTMEISEKLAKQIQASLRDARNRGLELGISYEGGHSEGIFIEDYFVCENCLEVLWTSDPDFTVPDCTSL